MNISRNPRIEIITIGREILDGRVIDTNSVFIADALKSQGLVPRSAQRVDDEVSRIIAAFEIAASRSDYILVTGGLGPTSDDLTAECFAQFLGEEVAINPEALAMVEDFFKKISRKMLDVQKKQALLPRSVKLLPNSEGSAPGFWGERRGIRFFFMPGVPREMKAMLTSHVLPLLPRVTGYASYTWATQFTSEGELNTRLEAIQANLPREFEITYRTRFPENHIGLHGPGKDEKFQSIFYSLIAEISKALGDDVFAAGEELQSLEQVVVNNLIKCHTLIGTVESCTGGLIAERITRVPGSSAAMAGAWTTYANEMKIDLGVNPNLIARHGAVSKEVAIAMAEAGCVKLQKLFPGEHVACVSTTGIAGPSGGTAEKPVGLCHIALAGTQIPLQHFELHGRAGWPRQELRTLFSQKALDMIRRSFIPDEG